MVREIKRRDLDFQLASRNLDHHASQCRLGKVWKLSNGAAINGSVAGEWMVYRQFPRRTEQFTLKFQMTLLFPSVEL